MVGGEFMIQAEAELSHLRELEQAEDIKADALIYGYSEFMSYSRSLFDVFSRSPNPRNSRDERSRKKFRAANHN